MTRATGSFSAVKVRKLVKPRKRVRKRETHRQKEAHKRALHMFPKEPYI